ncbi:MAG: type II secretion system F family protein [Nanoarchaeota archaeon]
MELQKMHWIGIIFGGILVLVSLIFFYTEVEKNLFIFLIGLGIATMAFPFIVGVVNEGKKEQELNEMFLEFSRNLAESVNIGTPVSKSIINMARKKYGALTPHIEKLGNQIGLGIPVHRAFENFARDINNPVISRAVTLISEAERAGGEIDYILDSVAESISQIEKLKIERKTAVSSLVVQGYIIYFIFIGIMLMMEFQILPLAAQVSSLKGLSTNSLTLAEGALQTPVFSKDNLASLFLSLLLAQGFFCGFAIGKLTEGNLKAGIKHSFIMMISAFLITSGIHLFKV